MANPGFMAFQKLKKHIADKLGIPNSVRVAKIGGAILKTIKIVHPDIDSIKAAAEAIKEFDNNMDKYKKMLVYDLTCDNKINKVIGGVSKPIISSKKGSKKSSKKSSKKCSKKSSKKCS
jgi:hypothetical protein